MEFVPGVVTPPTKASKSVYWREANLMRWTDGKLSPIGGWSGAAYPPTSSPIRRMFTWRSIDGRNYTALLCTEHLYVDINGTLVDITPVEGMEPPFSGSGGFGDGDYNADEFGTPRPYSGREIINPTYTLSNWGEDLLAMTSHDGRLLRWSPSSPDSKAEVVTGAPVGRGFAVTPERFVIIFDYNGNMGQFAWCNQEDIESWDFADPLKTAGFLPVYPSSHHHSHVNVPGGVLVFSQAAVYVIEYQGGAFVYGFRVVDETGNVPLSDRSVVPTPNGATWLSRGGLWRFDGISVVPVACPIWNWVKENCSFYYSRFVASAVHIPANSEVFFFFPSSSTGKNDRYALYNYKEGWWSMGKMCRSAGISPSYNSFPLMADETRVYQHEYGPNYPGADEFPWIETYAFTTPGKDVTVFQMEPDLEGLFGHVRFSLKYRNSLSGGGERSSPPRSMYNGKVDFVQTGREVRLRVECIANNADPWTLGDSEIIMKTVTKK